MQRLWSQTVTPAVTALAWRPDGKQLVAGCADGHLHTMDTELGDVTSITHMSKARIVGARSGESVPASSSLCVSTTSCFGSVYQAMQWRFKPSMEAHLLQRHQP